MRKSCGHRGQRLASIRQGNSSLSTVFKAILQWSREHLDCSAQHQHRPNTVSTRCLSLFQLFFVFELYDYFWNLWASRKCSLTIFSHIIVRTFLDAISIEKKIVSTQNYQWPFSDEDNVPENIWLLETNLVHSVTVNKCVVYTEGVETNFPKRKYFCPHFVSLIN